jgi:hypothetical protein
MKDFLKASLAFSTALAGLLALPGPSQAGSDSMARGRTAHHAFAAAARGGHHNEGNRSESSASQWRSKSSADWAAEHLRWMLSIPLGANPLTDTSGLNCAINQEGPVWFLSFLAVPNFTFNCTVPYGKAIVSPVVASANTYPCPRDPVQPDAPPFEPAGGQTLEDFLTNGITSVIDQYNGEARLNGRSLKVRRVTTPVFGFTAAASLNAVDPCVTGSPQLAVVDGYFVLIEPLPRGDHVLQITSGGPGFASVGTFNLKVR